MGMRTTKGTKLFAITGKTATTGLAGVPLGMSLHTIIFKLAGESAGGGSKRSRSADLREGACPRISSLPPWTMMP